MKMHNYSKVYEKYAKKKDSEFRLPKLLCYSICYKMDIYFSITIFYFIEIMLQLLKKYILYKNIWM